MNNEEAKTKRIKRITKKRVKKEEEKNPERSNKNSTCLKQIDSDIILLRTKIETSKKS